MARGHGEAAHEVPALTQAFGVALAIHRTGILYDAKILGILDLLCHIISPFAKLYKLIDRHETVF